MVRKIKTAYDALCTAEDVQLRLATEAVLYRQRWQDTQSEEDLNMLRDAEAQAVGAMAILVAFRVQGLS